MLQYNPPLKQVARRLRAAMTDAEQRLWRRPINPPDPLFQRGNPTARCPIAGVQQGYLWDMVSPRERESRMEGAWSPAHHIMDDLVGLNKPFPHEGTPIMMKPTSPHCRRS